MNNRAAEKRILPAAVDAGAAVLTAMPFIPGSSNSVHTADNLGAMRGRLPDSDQRNRMVAFVDSL